MGQPMAAPHEEAPDASMPAVGAPRVPVPRASLLGFAGAGAAGLVGGRALFLMAGGTLPWSAFQDWIYHGIIPMIAGALIGASVGAGRRAGTRCALADVAAGRDPGGWGPRLAAGATTALVLEMSRQILALFASHGALAVLGVPLAVGPSVAAGLGLFALAAPPQAPGGGILPAGILAAWIAGTYGLRFWTARALLAGVTDGLALGLALMAAGSPGREAPAATPPRLRWLALAALATVAGLWGLSCSVQSSVDARCRAIERTCDAVRATQRWREDPAFARLTGDVLVRVGKVREWARYPLKYSLSWYGPFAGRLPLLASRQRLDLWLDDAQELAGLLLVAARPEGAEAGRAGNAEPTGARDAAGNTALGAAEVHAPGRSGEPPGLRAASGASEPWYASLLGSFRVPCVVEERESPNLRVIVGLYRGGLPLASIAAVDDPDLVRDYENQLAAQRRRAAAPEVLGRPPREGKADGGAVAHVPTDRSRPEPADREGEGWTYHTVWAGGRPIDLLEMERPPESHWPRYFEIKAPSPGARGWLAGRLAAREARPLEPRDIDAYVALALAAGRGDPPSGEPRSSGTDPSVTAAARILADRLPLVGDLHMHTNATFSAMAPPGLVARAAFSQMMDVVAITEHWGADAGARAREAISGGAQGPILVPGEEVSLGHAHVIALCMSRWIEEGWFTFDDDPGTVAREIASRGGLPVLAHPFYPPEDWQADALLDGPGPFRAFEDSHWVPDALWDRYGEHLNLLGVSDAHQACFAGEPRTLLMVKERSEGGVREAIETGHCIALDASRPDFCRGSPRMRAVVRALLSRGQSLDREFFAQWKGRVVLEQPVWAWSAP